MNEYRVRYGGMFRVDPLGFVGRGNVRLREDGVELTGRRLWPRFTHWAVIAVVASFLWIFFLPEWTDLLLTRLFGYEPEMIPPSVHFYTELALVGVLLLVLRTLTHYFFVSGDYLKIGRKTLRKVERCGKKLDLTYHREVAGTTIKTGIKIDSEEKAKELEEAVKKMIPAAEKPAEKSASESPH